MTDGAVLSEHKSCHPPESRFISRLNNSRRHRAAPVDLALVQKSWREIHHQTTSQQGSRSRSESQASAGDMCPSFLVKLGAKNSTVSFSIMIHLSAIVQWGGEMMCMKFSFYIMFI